MQKPFKVLITETPTCASVEAWNISPSDMVNVIVGLIKTLANDTDNDPLEVLEVIHGLIEFDIVLTTLTSR